MLAYHTMRTMVKFVRTNFLLIFITALISQAYSSYLEKPAVKKRLLDGDIMISVKTLSPKPSLKMSVEGAGMVKAPLKYTFKQATNYSELAKMSVLIDEVKVLNSREILMKMSAFGYSIDFNVKVFEKNNGIHFEIHNGLLAGLRGKLRLIKEKRLLTRVAIDAMFVAGDTRLPEFFLNFGMEVVFEKMATHLRAYVENMYRSRKWKNNE